MKLFSSSLNSNSVKRNVLGVFPPLQQKYRISGAVPLLCAFHNIEAYFYQKELNSTRTGKRNKSEWTDQPFLHSRCIVTTN